MFVWIFDLEAFCQVTHRKATNHVFDSTQKTGRIKQLPVGLGVCRKMAVIF